MKTDDTLYHPAAALVLFKPEQGNGDLYIEYYDMDENGCPVNPRPLTVAQANRLAKALNTKEQAAKAFLKPKGILPACVLHINPAEDGSVVWYTRPAARKLYFSEGVGLQNGTVCLPALLWRASRKQLFLYALKGKSKPSLSTPLWHAPFMNVYHNGNVCMGSVDVRIGKAAALEAFITAWEGYFFGSYFSHLIGHNPISGNLISLYGQLIETGAAFPVGELLPCNKTLKDLLL